MNVCIFIISKWYNGTEQKPQIKKDLRCFYKNSYRKFSLIDESLDHLNDGVDEVSLSLLKFYRDSNTEGHHGGE